MDSINAAQGYLEFASCPAFSVQNGFVIYTNSAAQSLTIFPGTPVESLLLVGKEEYASTESGCLSLTLSISGQPFGASVIKMSGQDVFLLDPQEQDPAQQALALASMSLRGPLSLIMDNAKALQEAPGTMTAEEKARLRKLAKGAYQLLLQVSNMSQAASYASDPAPSLLVNMESLFREVVEKTATLLEKQGIRVLYNGLGKPALAPGDSHKLERALYNLIVNAAKSLDGSGSIEVTLSQGNGKLYLTVEDDGRGIPDEVLPSLFYRYQRPPALESGPPSIGLGLSLARSVAMAHGGTILVQRRQPKGTRVTMTLAQPKQSRDTVLRSAALRVDPFGGYDQALVELSQILPDALYEE